MPNWCSTKYTISGAAAQKVYNIIESLHNSNESNWNWLGNIISKLGGDPEKIYSRGWIDDYSFENGCLILYCETAWGECTEWRHFINNTLDCDVIFTAEEPGNGVYETNDSDMDTYKVEFVDEDFYTSKESEVLKAVCNKCNIPFEPIGSPEDQLRKAREIVRNFNEVNDDWIEIATFDFIED